MLQQFGVNLALLQCHDPVASAGEENRLNVARNPLDAEYQRDRARHLPDFGGVAVRLARLAQRVDDVFHHPGGHCGGRGNQHHGGNRHRIVKPLRPQILAQKPPEQPGFQVFNEA